MVTKTSMSLADLEVSMDIVTALVEINALIENKTGADAVLLTDQIHATEPKVCKRKKTSSDDVTFPIFNVKRGSK